MDTNPSQTSAPLSDLEASIAERVEEARQNLARLNEQALELIRERPGACLLLAVALGFTVGKLAARI